MSEREGEDLSKEGLTTAGLAHHRFPWRIFLIAALLITGWLAFLGITGTRADLAESNLQANLIRITRYLRTPSPDTVLVGSSIAGRLLPEYFPGDGPEVLNLGLDGSRPLFGFEVLATHAQAPRLVLLETATLFQPLMVNDETLREAMASTTAQLSAKVPFFRPEVRPVTVAYETLKAWREGLGAGRARPPMSVGDRGVTHEKPTTYRSVKKAILDLRAKGSEVILIKIPAGEGWAMPQDGAARQLADELGLKIVQPGKGIYAREGDVLRFTDGLHLDAPSARKLSLCLSTCLSQTGTIPAGE